MAKKIRLEMNSKGFQELLKSQAVQDDLARRANAIAAAAGEGMEARTRTGNLGDRVVAEVRTATYEARRAEATDKALTSAIDAGRT